jgi:prophage antirepressor-like protein
MSELISINDVFNRMFDERGVRIVLVESKDENVPWFCGRDVCEILGYANYRDTIHTHIEDECKQQLGNILVVGVKQTTSLSYNELKATYINEEGLMSLLFACKLPIGKRFRKWVLKEVLPSIRKTGKYELQNALTASKTQLALKDKSEQELKTKLQAAEKEREKACAKLRSETQRYRNHIKKALEFNQATKKVEPLEYVYVATTDRYQDHHKFKIGGTATFELLKSRLNQYNSGESDSDSHYYVYTRKTVNYKAIEHTVQGLLSGFRENQSKELYIIHYDWLIKCLDAILDGNVELALFINSSRDRIVYDTTTKSPTIASPIQLETIIYSRAGDDPHDVTALLAPELIETIKTAIDSYAPDNNTIKRKEFEQRLLELDPDLRLEGKRKTAWNVVRQLGSLTNPMWRYKY